MAPNVRGAAPPENRAAELRADLDQARLDLEKTRAEREARRWEKDASQRQRLQKRLDGLLLIGAVLTASLLVIALLLGSLLREQRARASRAQAVTQKANDVQERRMEADLLGRALSAATWQERSRNLDFLVKAGFVRSASPRLRTLSPENPAGLPYLPWLAAVGPSSVPSVPSAPARMDGPLAAVAQVKRSSLVRVEERPAPPVRPERTARTADEPPREPADPGPARTETARGENAEAGAESSQDVYTRARQTLQSQGYYKGPMDGRYDANTKNAVARFQREHGLEDDGLLGPRTLRVIEERRRSGGSARR